MARPNVLLLVLDTARADGFAPYADRKTPTIGQLASRGTAAKKAIAPSCWTVPSHASMLLGAPPRSVGLSRVPQNEGPLVGEVLKQQVDRYLPAVLTKQGYATAGVSANLWVSNRIGFSLGFENFTDVTGERVKKMSETGLKTRVKWYLDAVRSRADDGALAIESLLKTWMAGTHDKPFFWFVNLLECHSPYLPPKPYNDLGPLQRVAAAEDSRRYQTLEGVLRAAATRQGPPEKANERMRHLYDRSIELMDDWLARILSALDASKLLDDTVVIVTSDHGENFGEGGLIGHAGSLDDRLVSVPLVLAGPNVAPFDGVVSMNDLPRIIAKLTELADHPWGDIESPGIALSQYDGPVHADRMAVLDSWSPTPDGRARLTERFTSATDGTLKLVRGGEVDKLYDIEVDPLEIKTVSEAGYPQDRINALRDALDRATAQGWDPQVGEAPAESGEDTVAIEERMRLLGYL